MKHFILLLILAISLSSCTKVLYTKGYKKHDKVHREYKRRAATNKKIQLYYQYEHSGKANISSSENQSRRPSNHRQ